MNEKVWKGFQKWGSRAGAYPGYDCMFVWRWKRSGVWHGCQKYGRFRKKVTLQLMFPKNSGSADPRAQWMHDNVEAFKKVEPNINFDVIDNTSGDNYLTTVTTRMAANDVPDIFQTWTLERLRPFAESNRVYDLTEFLNSTRIKE